MLPLVTRPSFFAERWSWWDIDSDSDFFGTKASGNGCILDQAGLTNHGHVVFGPALNISGLGRKSWAEGGVGLLTWIVSDAKRKP